MEYFIQKTGLDKKFSKPQYSCEIRNFCIKTDAQEALKTQAVDQGILNRRIAQIVQMLEHETF